MRVELPQRGPLIVGGKPRYSIGDTVELNCTSLRSSPAANLTWYINGELVMNIIILMNAFVVMFIQS